MISSAVYYGRVRINTEEMENHLRHCPFKKANPVMCSCFLHLAMTMAILNLTFPPTQEKSHDKGKSLMMNQV